MTWLDLPVDDDASKILDRSLDDFQARGFTVRIAAVETAIFAATAERVAEVATLLGLVTEHAFTRSTGSLRGLPQYDGAVAESTTTWTLAAAAALTIPAGTRVGWARPDGTLVRFATTADLIVPVGPSTTSDVVVRALAPGATGNGLPAGPLTLIDDRGSVLSVVADLASSGGVDPEPDAVYRDRLVSILARSSVAAIIASDFAALAVDDVQVHRAIGLERYDPAQLPPTGRNGHVTVALADEQGGPVPQSGKDRVAAMFDAARVVNRLPHLIDATYMQVTIAFSFVADASANPTVVRLDAEQRVRDLIDPARWAGGGESPAVWRDERLLRHEDVVVAIRSTPGVDHTTSVTVNGGSADLVLAGPAALPAPFDAAAPSTVSGTAVSA